jgi:hypothetical protein
MAKAMLDLVRSRLAHLQEESESARAEREAALRTIADCEQTVAQNASTIKVLEEILADAGRVNRNGDGGKEGALPTAVDTPSKGKPKATAAIFALIDAEGTVSRDKLLSLKIDTDAGNPRHILQTTLYTLKKKGKLVENADGSFRRPAKGASH